MLSDPKALGAFIEYTLRPILEDARELLEFVKKENIDIETTAKFALCAFLFERVLGVLVSIIVTGGICFTVYRVALLSLN